jgi:hypothetical protein
MKYNRLITITLILSLNCTQLLAINYTNTSVAANTSTHYKHEHTISQYNQNIHEKLTLTHEKYNPPILTNIKHNNNFSNLNKYTLARHNLNNTTYIIDENGNIGCMSKYYHNNSTHNSISTNNTLTPITPIHQVQNSTIWQRLRNSYDKIYEKTQHIRSFLYQQCIEFLIASLILKFADHLACAASVPMILIPDEIFNAMYNDDALRYLPIERRNQICEGIQPRYDICPLFLYPVELSPRTLEYMKTSFDIATTLTGFVNALAMYTYLWLFNKEEFNHLDNKKVLRVEIIQLTLKILINYIYKK